MVDGGAGWGDLVAYSPVPFECFGLDIDGPRFTRLADLLEDAEVRL